MSEQNNELYEQLLLTWNFWREKVNNQCRALQLLMQNDPDHPQYWQELGEQIISADRSLREADARLSRYEAILKS
jgi:hypothetical protein